MKKNLKKMVLKAILILPIIQMDFKLYLIISMLIKGLFGFLFYRVEIVSIRSLPNYEDFEGLLALPCDGYPSDHLPIGCVVKI